MLSENARDTLKRLRYFHKGPETTRTRRLFEGAVIVPAFLDDQDLNRLQQRYPALREYGYDVQSMEFRGNKRAAQILALPGFARAGSVLEVGCRDGMVSCALQRAGKSATAIDRPSEGFDHRARAAGVSMREMDAEEMQFHDEAFDGVFSYDTFEHVARPDRVLAECIRVTRKGGFIYLNFGPLYMSAFGEHAHRSITVPYCQHLFSQPVLSSYAADHHLTPLDPAGINRWTLRDYRSLWKKSADVVSVERYTECLDISHLDLIRQHASCFRSKSDSFEEFTVAGIRILFKKIA
jgi:ubiquinone/menaquinone biosynthesis C-methylase UbiE